MAKILVAVTGSIAAYKACDLVSKLVQKNHEVQVILTKSAQQFVGAATFEGLTGQAPLSTGFEEGQRMAHIHWERWADLTLVYPATANTINRLAQGVGSDLLGMLFLAHDFNKPFWIAPAMNPLMLSHPVTRESLEKLSRWGVRIIESDTGRTACGEEGQGRLIEVPAMLAQIENHFSAAAVKKQKILVTAGGTSEAIDPVRVITNTSTGETGVQIADALEKSGFDVTLLLANSSTVQPSVGSALKTQRFTDFESLDHLMHEELSTQEYSGVVHAAAVSDYRVDRLEDHEGKTLSGTQKIHSGQGIKIALQPNPKIVNSLREYSKNRDIKIVSFKLTTDGEAPNLKTYQSDFVVHNDLGGISKGCSRHEGTIYDQSNSQAVQSFKTKNELKQAVCELFL